MEEEPRHAAAEGGKPAGENDEGGEDDGGEFLTDEGMGINCRLAIGMS